MMSRHRTWAPASTIAVMSVVAATLAIIVSVSTAPPVAALAAGEVPVATGQSFSCAITPGNGLACWGANGDGQLGNGTTTNAPVPTPVPALGSGVRGVSAGLWHTCAVTTAGAALCWGRNANGQLGNGTTTRSTVPVPVSGLSSGVQAISAGDTHTCALTTGGAVWCWGKGTSGQLGQGAQTGSNVPVAVSGLASGVASISAGVNHTCAVTTAGAALCWGQNNSGELGNGGSTDSAVPVAVTGASTGVASIAAGINSACLVTTSGGAKCWGYNTGRPLGVAPTTSPLRTPNDVVGLTSGVASIAISVSQGTVPTICAILTSGAVQCWGDNEEGQMVLPAQGIRSTPISIPGLSSGVVAIDVGAGHACALRDTGAMTCWGSGLSGQKGYGDPTTRIPTAVSGLASGVASVDIGGTHACALTSAGAPLCWGTQSQGQLGNNSLTTSLLPVAVSGLTSGVTSLALGGSMTCALTSAGGVKCWGRNNVGQLGRGSTTDSRVPVDVSGLTSGVIAIAAGSSHGCALTSTGGVKCWGSGASGQLGTGTTANATSPVDVTGLTSGVTAIAAGSNHTCAVLDTGALQCWGANTFGKLGNSTQTASSVPVDVTGLSSGVAAVAGGQEHTCALTTGGAMLCWGMPPQIGIEGGGGSTFPLPVVGLSSGVTAISAGSDHTCAIVSGGARCWGTNDRGQVGNGASTDATTPADVVGLSTGVTWVAAGADSSCAVADGALSCWGSNSFRVLARELVDDVAGGATFSGGTLAAPTISGDRTPAANGAGWNNEPVTVSFTCSSLALVSCTAPVTLSTDGAGQSVVGTATDATAQTASTTVSSINVDQVPPTLAGLATTAPNAAGWYRAPVTMAWTCSDDRSGIAPGACPPEATTVGEGAAVSVSSSVTDRAGNTATGSSESVQIDMTAPSTGVSSPPTWSKEDVTLTLTATDALSGVASTSYRIDGGPVQTGTAPMVSGEGVHSVAYWSTDLAGNVEATSSVTVRIDVTAPSITQAVSPAPNANGWHRGPVDVTFTCTDTGGSDVASCTGDQSFTTEADTVVTGTVTDAAGNTATAQATVRIDLHAPTITAQVPPANAAGWFNAGVQVPFSCTDTGGSGVDTCPAPQMFAGEGADQAITATGRDNAGNVGTATGDTVSIDLTAPTISGAVVEAPNPGGSHTGTVHVHFTCADALSGIVSCPADQTVSGVGVHVVNGSVTDRAGNTASAEVTVTIDPDTANDPGTIHGTITDAGSGTPIAGALVRLWNPAGTAVAYATTSGTDGTYTFPLLADGAYKLVVTKWGTHLQAWYPSAATTAGASTLTVAHGTNLTADQALAPGHVLSGTLTSSTTGNPVSGASVVLSNGITTTTDANGRYEIKGQATSTVGVRFVAYGYQPASATATLPGTPTIDRALTPSPSSTGIKGTVTAAATGPVAGATVRVWLKDASTFSVTITTNAQGRYTLASLPAGTYQVDVTRGGQRRWAPQVLSRADAASHAITTTCTANPVTAFGDPCSTNVDIAMP